MKAAEITAKSTGQAKLRMLRDFVALRVVTETKIGSILIPQSAQDIENPTEGIVVAVGDGLVEGGRIIPLTVKVGDHVYMPSAVGTWIKIKETGESFFICRENILFCAVEV